MTGSGGLRLGLGAAVAAVAVTGILAGSGMFTESALATARSETSLQMMNRQVLQAVNRFRIAHGLNPLRESRGLDSSARQHSLEMGRDGYFAHSSANGTSFWRRIQHYYPAGKRGYWTVGENLLWAAPSVSASRAMSMWIASPEHLRNLLTPAWRDIGVSAVRVVGAPGVFHGLHVTIITTDFGARH